MMGNRRNCSYGADGRRRAPRSAALIAAGLVVMAVLSPVVTGSAGATGAPSKIRFGFAPEIPSGAAAVSPLTSAAILRVDVVLQPRDPAALTSYARAVSTPGSGQYRHYLSEAQFVARFGPTRGTVESVRRALIGSGLHPGAVSSNDLSIPIRATAARLSTAFATGFRRYRVLGGRIAYANTDAPQLPGSVASSIQSVVGLDDLNLAAPAGSQSSSGGVPADARPSSGGGPKACTTASIDAAEQGSHTADQVGTDYGFPSFYGQGDLGSGQAVALYELQGFGSADIATYRTCFKTSTPVTTVNVDGGPSAGSGVGEADVDIEQVMSLAPDVHILVYQGPNSGAGGYDTYNSIIAQDEAKVISTSWGLCETLLGSATARSENTLFEEAAVQGQTVVAAAGDEGSEDCVAEAKGKVTNDTLAVDDPASQPFVTGAGGTSWTAAGAPPTERAWNDGPTCCWGAGGGGISELWAMPSYQADSGAVGVINPDSSGTICHAATGAYCREVPDVSALSGSYPYLDYVGGSWGSWGGTSLAAPLWASLIALADASASCSGKDIGFANPILYQVAAADPTAFNDVTVGDNDLTGKSNGMYPATVGYDMATGLGTPNVSSLSGELCAAAPVDPVSVTDPGGQRTHVASAVSLQIEATDSTAGQTLTYRAVGLPNGVAINRTSGRISGTPSVRGRFAPFVTVRDGDGASASVAFSWVVDLAITSATSARATIGETFSFTVRTTGVPRTFTVSPKPPSGLRFKNLKNGTATLSGTPSRRLAAGRYPLVFEANFGTKKSPDVVAQHFTLTLFS
ncbi:MAG: protease pro-enzyme activation domain-containing protein [Acidimicrobiales bacterium]|jgi:subtilase family serine protease